MTGPATPRWTHIALPTGDLDESIAWYERFTPLRVLARRADEVGQSAWLAHEGQVDNPFVLVLVAFDKDHGRRQPQLAPFAHIGIEMPERSDVDRLAELARAEGCLTWEPQQMPDPIGYICALRDPDGNVIEISHDQRVYDTVRRVWGASAPS
jgi:catechol 2,3-dioxygenase-like lactoylglutathione lyase family enzyme